MIYYPVENTILPKVVCEEEGCYDVAVTEWEAVDEDQESYYTFRCAAHGMDDHNLRELHEAARGYYEAVGELAVAARELREYVGMRKGAWPNV